jgi:hypothetical protein
MPGSSSGLEVSVPGIAARTNHCVFDSRVCSQELAHQGLVLFGDGTSLETCDCSEPFDIAGAHQDESSRFEHTGEVVQEVVDPGFAELLVEAEFERDLEFLEFSKAPLFSQPFAHSSLAVVVVESACLGGAGDCWG